MMFLYHAHSGLRFVVLMAGVLALGVALWALATGRPYGRLSRMSMMAFVGLVDVQVVLGLIMVFMGIWYPALMGHLMLMVMAAIAAHLAAVLARGTGDDAKRAHGLVAGGTAVTLALIAAGILAIRPGIFHVSPTADQRVVQPLPPAPDDGL